MSEAAQVFEVGAEVWDKHLGKGIVLRETSAVGRYLVKFDSYPKPLAVVPSDLIPIDLAKERHIKRLLGRGPQ